MSHSFVSKWTPSADQWNRIPDLVRIRAEPGDCFMCSYGCGLSAIGGSKAWADFSAGILITETTTSPCANSPSGAGGSASASAGTAASSTVRHPRIDMAAIVPKLKLTSTGPEPEILTYDERFMATVSEASRVAISAAHTIDAPTVRQQNTRLIRQLLSTAAALLNGIFSTILAGTPSPDFDVAHHAVIKDQPVADKSKASSLLQSAMIFIITARGLIDRGESLQTLQAQTFKVVKPGQKFSPHNNAWLKGMHTALRGDYAAIRDVVERPERVFSPLNWLEQNSFTVLGAAIVTRDASAVRAFFRLELPRETSEAKKIGWKPPDPDAASAEPAAGAAGGAAPSPDRSGGDKPKGGGGKQGGDGKPPKKRRRKDGGNKPGGKQQASDK